MNDPRKGPDFSATTHHGAIDRLHIVVMSLGVLAACANVGEDEVEYGELSSAISVSSYTTSTCSTSVVLGLSKQIADEVGCIEPGGLVRFEPTGNLKLSSSAVLPYLGGDARADLKSVAANRLVQVNSAFRTVAQQYLLYRWYQLGRCGITAAATPGRSNHESGRALDLANYSSLIGSMADYNWSHDVPGDPVHFDHLDSPDIRGRDVQAFQRLWNRNNPKDPISEDGAYGPQTEARIKAAPATGFAIGADCGTSQAQQTEVVMVEGPDKVAPGARADYTLTVANQTALDWPANAKLMVVGGSSELYDPERWVAADQIGVLQLDVPIGTQGVVTIPVRAPMVSEETAVALDIAVTDGATTFGTFQLALTVTPNGDDGTSGDADDAHDGAVIGGCSAGGGATSLGACAVIGLFGLRRKRARR